ncbi:MAG: hypothetical protein IJ769_02415 [Clostridia bacterium]|nr:hypothetical protein [Clostridia bacterium]
MKIITSVTVFNDAVGMRMSATYSEVDDATGRITNDNQRFDRVITDETAKTEAQAILAYAAENL